MSLLSEGRTGIGLDGRCAEAEPHSLKGPQLMLDPLAQVGTSQVMVLELRLKERAVGVIVPQTCTRGFQKKRPVPRNTEQPLAIGHWPMPRLSASQDGTNPVARGASFSGASLPAFPTKSENPFFGSSEVCGGSRIQRQRRPPGNAYGEFASPTRPEIDHLNPVPVPGSPNKALDPGRTCHGLSRLCHGFAPLPKAPESPRKTTTAGCITLYLDPPRGVQWTTPHYL